MDVIRGDGSVLENINLSPENEHEEIVQNVALILASVQNSIPMLRDVGIPGENMGRPLPVVENLLVGHIYDQVEKNEPRAQIQGITFEVDHEDGNTIPIVTIKGVSE